MTIKAEEVFQHLNKEWKWIAMDSDGKTYVFHDKPIKEYVSWDTKNVFIIIPIDIDFGTNDWTKCCVKRPIDESEWIGKLCYFWNDDEDDKSVYILDGINVSVDYPVDNPYDNPVDNPYEPQAPAAPTKNCRPLTKEEVLKLIAGED